MHTHFAPASVLAAARRGQGFDGMTTEHTGGQEWLVHRQGFRWPVPPVFYDLPARLAAMDRRGTGLAPADTELIAGRNAAALFGIRG